MVKRVVRACDVCGIEHEYVYKYEEPIPAWLLPGWCKKPDFFRILSFMEQDDRDKYNTNLGECCPDCVKTIREAFNTAVTSRRALKRKIDNEK